VNALFFAYGSFREGEPDHDALSGAASLGAVTVPGLRLVDLGPYPAVVPVGTPTGSASHAVVGELYEVSEALLSRLDVCKQHPALFQRGLITLADGRSAHVYLMADAQVQGRRRLPGGDWKKRFERPARSEFTVPRRYRP
jgi:gamma-glutamylcyclotransferase (GGCT)/AIG2-like uncharacterized protein YtfP